VEDNITSIESLRSQGRKTLNCLSDLPAHMRVAEDVISLEVDVLLCFCLGWSRAKLYSWPETQVENDTVLAFNSLITRRANLEPIAYLVGSKEFYGIEFEVTPAVLIPRPETEIIVSRALEIISKSFVENKLSKFCLIDVGVGSGAIILSILKTLKEKFGEECLRSIRAVATDISKAALDVAKNNASKLELEQQIEFHQTSLLDSVAASQEDQQVLIVSNPPYIPAGNELSLEVADYEPETALFAGSDGLAVITELVKQSYLFLPDKGKCLIEIGIAQDQAVKALATKQGFYEATFIEDFQGINRVVELSR
jgi:release factor glutamine methyltransferase